MLRFLPSLALGFEFLGCETNTRERKRDTEQETPPNSTFLRTIEDKKTTTTLKKEEEEEGTMCRILVILVIKRAIAFSRQRLHLS